MIKVMSDLKTKFARFTARRGGRFPIHIQVRGRWMMSGASEKVVFISLTASELESLWDFLLDTCPDTGVPDGG